MLCPCGNELSNVFICDISLLLLSLLTRLHEIIEDRERSIIHFHNLVNHRTTPIRPSQCAIGEMNARRDGGHGA